MNRKERRAKGVGSVADAALDARVQTGFGHHKAGRMAEAEDAYRAVLAENPNHVEALHLLGGLALESGNAARAVELIESAIKLRADVPHYHLNIGEAYRRAGLLEKAIAATERALRLKPDYADAHYNLGNLHRMAGRSADALDQLERALALKPDLAFALNNMGGLLLELGRARDAIAAYERALALQPDNTDFLNNLGNAHILAGAPDKALGPLERAIALKPDLAAALNNLGNVFRAFGKADEAIATYKRAIAIAPDVPDAISNLGVALQDKGDLTGAVENYRHAIALAPGSGQHWNNLGSALQDAGELQDAIAAFRRGIELEPRNAMIRTNLIFALDFDPSLDAEGLQTERRRWWSAIGEPIRPKTVAHDNDPNPERKLRVGYVSSFFRWHSSAQAFAPVILAHDDARYEVVCYSGGVHTDELTERLKKKAILWRSTLGLTDAELAAQIRADKIDVLVDCVGHMHGHRLEAFCLKPAPVQVTAWGQNNGTGIPLIDGIFVDPVLLPEPERRFYAEKPVDLPCAIMYMAPENAPPVATTPRTGPVVFGAFNRLSKMSDGALALWARIVEAVPESRIVFKGRYLDAPESQARVREAFDARGIDPSRLAFMGETERLHHMAAYDDIDIALDPLPQGGGISTLDSLWMGVPVVTLYGHNVSGRPTASVLSAIGLSDWIARTPDEYVALAVRKAADRADLGALRSTLRGRLAASPVANAGLYTRAVEDGYRKLLRAWCATKPSAVMAAPRSDAAPPPPAPNTEPAKAPTQPRQSALSRKDRRAAAAGASAGLDKLFADAVTHHKAGRIGDAEKLYRDIIAAKPDHADALSLLGSVALQVGSQAGAVELFRRAVAAAPSNAVFHANLGEALRQSSRTDEALAAFDRSIALEGKNPIALYHRGLALIAKGRKAEAAESFGKAAALDPKNHQALNNLGATFNDLGRFDEAAEVFRRANEIVPNDAMVLVNYGHALVMIGKAEQAVDLLKHATRLLPSAAAAAWGNLGNAYRSLRRGEEAIEAYRKGIALAPKQVDLRVNLAGALSESSDLQGAIDTLSDALDLAPESALAWNNLGSALQELGHLDGAAKSFRRALALAPGDWRVHTNVIFTNDFDPTLDAAGIQAERRRWWEMHGAPLAHDIAPHDNDRDSERRLRIGYIGSFFRWHSSSQAFAPAILDADPTQSEIVIYSATAPEDELTARFRARASTWIDVHRMDDETLAKRVREDRVDILVDLCGHMGGTRLPVFCRKPAPVQVTAWGQANGTGIPLIDAFFTDPIIMPEAERIHIAERAVDLPCALTFLPPPDAPDVAPTPAAARGYMTFGSFNRMSKLNDETFDLWGAILRALPDARLLFKGRYLDRAPNQNPIVKALAQRGVDPARLAFRPDSPRREHLAAFADIDIQLDPTPQGGGISTLDALWMGVPVLTLHARTVNGRAAASIQTVLGMQGMVARTAEEYVGIAVQAAKEIPDLAQVRAGLRDRMRATPIGNGPLYARAVEAAYRNLWRGWCARRLG